MYRYLLLALSLVPSAALAQTPPHTPKLASTKPIVPADTLYFDQDWERTDIPEDRKYARLVRFDQDSPPTGTVRDFYYPSWKKQWEGKLLSQAPDLPTGLCTFWYDNGKLKARGTYRNGQPLSDYQEWHPDGTLVKCKLQFTQALPTEQVQLHSYWHNGGGTQHVFVIELPENTTSIIYRFDIRDEGQAPIGWNSAFTLAKVATTGSLGLLDLGTMALQAEERQQRLPTISTQCHYFLTTNVAQAKTFLLAPDDAPVPANCLLITRNTQREVRPLTLPAGTRRLYMCVNNDNLQTAAVAQLSVSALVKVCQ